MRTTMTVGQLREALSIFPDDKKVMFVSRTGASRSIMSVRKYYDTVVLSETERATEESYG